MKNKIKRIVALCIVVLIFAMVIATFVIAILNKPGTKQLLGGMIVCDIALPIIAWGYVIIYNVAKRADEKMNNEVDRLIKEPAKLEDNKENIDEEASL